MVPLKEAEHPERMTKKLTAPKMRTKRVLQKREVSGDLPMTLPSRMPQKSEQMNQARGIIQTMTWFPGNPNRKIKMSAEGRKGRTQKGNVLICGGRVVDHGVKFWRKVSDRRA